MICTPSTGLSSKRGTYQLIICFFLKNLRNLTIYMYLKKAWFDKEERRNKKKRVNIDTRSSIFIID